MVDRRASPPPNNPSVLLVERMLSQAVSRVAVDVPLRGRQAVVDRAVWFCTCATDDEADTPMWLIYDTADGGLGWCRVDNDDGDGDMTELVDAQELFGDHVHPAQVAEWLQGADPGALFDLSGAGLAALRELGRRIRELQGT